MAATHFSGPLYVGGDRLPVLSAVVTITTGATDVANFSVQVVDETGTAMTGVRAIDVYMSDDATGAGISATSYSTGLAIVTGDVLATLSSAKAFTVLTTAAGVATFTLTDTNNSADEYMCVVSPTDGTISLSDATVAGDYGA